MTVLHFIRHGEVDNPQQVLYARLPHFHLSAEGRRQAEAAAAHLAARPLEAVISSPRLRARQTAQTIAARHDLPVRTSRLVDEIRTPYQGRPVAEMDAAGWLLFTDLPPGYETPADITARALRLIERLRRQLPGGEAVVVTHGDIVLAVRFWVQGVEFTDATKNAVGLYPATCSITMLTYPNGPVAVVDGAEPRPAMAYHRPY